MCQHTNGILADQRDNKPRSAEELYKAARELAEKRKREEMEFLKDVVR